MMACLDPAGRDVAAMRAGDVARDRKPQPGAAFFPVCGHRRA